LEVDLEEGQVVFSFVTFHREKVKSSVDVSFVDGTILPVSGTSLGEAKKRRSPGAHFVMGEKTKNFYVGRDLRAVQDYKQGLGAIRAEREKLRLKFCKEVSEAKANIPGVEAEIKLKMATLAKTDVPLDAYLKDVRFSLLEDKLDALNRRLRDYRNLIQRGTPDKINSSYARELWFGGVDILKLSDIVSAVAVEKRRLVSELGLLPLKPSTIRLSNVIEGVVTWRV